jgi:hypothetical protein
MAKICKGRHYTAPEPLTGEDARREGLRVLAVIIARCQLNSAIHLNSDGGISGAGANSTPGDDIAHGSSDSAPQ